MRTVNSKLFAGAVAVVVGVSVFAGDTVPPASDQKNEIKQIISQQHELRNSFREVQKRLKVYQDPQVLALKDAMVSAQKAYNAKIEELVTNDPEGATIVQKLHDNDDRIKELQKEAIAQRQLKKEVKINAEKKNEAAKPAM
ncbi:MAG: hypothetical protein JXN60_06655 [Lentisphaerae bacterium]|nr:hypothetical protein [Lentisphaerota bacterium]